MQYKILTSRYDNVEKAAQELQNKVDRWTNLGWRLYEGPSIAVEYTIGDYAVYIIQAMVKDNENQ